MAASEVSHIAIQHLREKLLGSIEVLFQRSSAIRGENLAYQSNRNIIMTRENELGHRICACARRR
jgi:hypothetical protein